MEDRTNSGRDTQSADGSRGGSLMMGVLKKLTEIFRDVFQTTRPEGGRDRDVFVND